MNDFARGEFLQGFLEEAHEHLETINQNLLRLEVLAKPSAGEPGVLVDVERTERLSELFRSFHTLKGLSGMIGLHEASALSHSMEDALKRVQGREFKLLPHVLDQLFVSTRTLTAVVDTLTDPDRPMPDIQVDQHALEQIFYGQEPGAITPNLNTGNPVGPVQQPEIDTSISPRRVMPGLDPYPEMLAALGEIEQKKIVAAANEGQVFALVVFMSSAERAAQGENVDLVRQQIHQSGTLIKAAPAMTPSGIRFLFLVASPQLLNQDEIIADEIIPLAVNLSAQSNEPGSNRSALIDTSDPHYSGLIRSSAVRVALERLDEMLRYAGDLTILRSQMAFSLKRLNGAPLPVKRELQQTYLQFGRTLRDLRRVILQARMVPLAETFNHMPLVVRDLARMNEKEVQLNIEGEANEVDKLLVERLLDPLIHLIRNAIIHGIEPPAERMARGKPVRGTLTLRGIPEGDHIQIEVADDGRGLNFDKIAAMAEARGWYTAGQPLDMETALDIISQPGFSTQTEADLVAGRGVGMDVVRRMVKAFGGHLSMKSTEGKGTVFRMRLPLTLVIVDVLIVNVAHERYAIPRDMVRRIIEINPDEITQIEGRELLRGEDRYYVLYDLGILLGTYQTETAHQGRYGLVISNEETTALEGSSCPLLLVDKVADLREVVVHPLTDSYLAQPGIDGVTEMGDGTTVLIVDVPSLLRQSYRPSGDQRANL